MGRSERAKSVVKILHRHKWVLQSRYEKWTPLTDSKEWFTYWICDCGETKEVEDNPNER